MSRLKVDVELEQGKFQAGMEKLHKSLEGIKSIGEAAFIFVAAEKAVEYVSELVGKTLEYADAIDKTSIRMHLSTDEVQALGIVAQDAGSKLETIEEAYRKIGIAKEKALTGDKAALAALTKLGVSSEQLHAKDGTLGILGQVASSAGKGGEQEQSALANLGLKAAAGDLTAVGDSIKHIHETVQELKAAGRIISEEDINRIAAAKDEFEAIEQQLAVELTPVISKVMYGIADGIYLVKDYFGTLFDVIKKMAEDTINWVKNLSKNGLGNAKILTEEAVMGYLQAGPVGMIAHVMSAPTIGNDKTIGDIVKDDGGGFFNTATDKIGKDFAAFDQRIDALMKLRAKQRQQSDAPETVPNVEKKKFYSDNLTQSGNFLGASFGHAGFVASQMDLQKRQVDIGRQQLDESKKQTELLSDLAKKNGDGSDSENWMNDFN